MKKQHEKHFTLRGISFPTLSLRPILHDIQRFSDHGEIYDK